MEQSNSFFHCMLIALKDSLIMSPYSFKRIRGEVGAVSGLPCCSVAKSYPALCDTMYQHSRLPCPSLSPCVCSNSCPLSQWCHPTISPCVTSFSSCPQSFPASESFPMSQLFTSGGWNIGAPASVLPMNSLGSFPLGMTSLISCSPRDSQESFPVPQLENINSSVFSLLYDPTLKTIHDYWKNHSFDYTDLCQQSSVSAF